MTFKDQLTKLRDNWLIILLVVIVLALFLGSSSMGRLTSSYRGYSMMESDSYAGGYNTAAKYSSGYYPNPGSSDFAPDVEERKIVKTSSMSSEVERGNFKSAEERLKGIVTSSDSFLLYSHSSSSGSGRREYYSGSYTIKVDTKKYAAVVSQLKELGKVVSLNENSQDITGSYTNVNIELAAERSRLDRYNNMYNDSIAIADKLSLTDRIFDQERKVKYLEESLTNMDQRVDYSEIRVTLSEKRSDYSDITLATFSKLVKSLVSSFNVLLYALFVVAPWAVAAFVVYLLARLFRKKPPVAVEKKAK